jgi:hypothetical protein
MKCNLMTRMKAGFSQMVRTPAKEDVKIVAVGKESWRSSSDNARKLGLSQVRII